MILPCGSREISCDLPGVIAVRLSPNTHELSERLGHECCCFQSFLQLQTRPLLFLVKNSPLFLGNTAVKHLLMPPRHPSDDENISPTHCGSSFWLLDHWSVKFRIGRRC